MEHFNIMIDFVEKLVDLQCKLVGTKIMSLNPVTNKWKLPQVVEHDGSCYFIRPEHTDIEYDELPSVGDIFPNDYYMTKGDYYQYLKNTIEENKNANN